MPTLTLSFDSEEEMQQVTVLYAMFFRKNNKEFPNGMKPEDIHTGMKDWELLRALDHLYEKGVLLKLEYSNRKYRFQILPDCSISLCITGCSEKPRSDILVR